MINGLNSALSGMQGNAARFDRAAAQIANVGASGADEAGVAAAHGGGELSDQMVEMITAKFGFTASLRAASASSDMMLEAIHLGGYAS
ncbi:MAG: hypothetical protein M3081_16145 [Gemmatimonadota bacterium]|nr:hypothetical protein [Gemmatimonadota bacterium]